MKKFKLLIIDVNRSAFNFRVGIRKYWIKELGKWSIIMIFWMISDKNIPIWPWGTAKIFPNSGAIN